jgi:hypothetical protein
MRVSALQRDSHGGSRFIFVTVLFRSGAIRRVIAGFIPAKPGYLLSQLTLLNLPLKVAGICTTLANL